MLRINSIKLPVKYNEDILRKAVCSKLKVKSSDIKELTIIKRSLDSRKKNDIHYLFTVDVQLNINEKSILKKNRDKNISESKPNVYVYPPRKEFEKRPVIVGLGPAGLFCALILAECGAKPIVLERGESVDDRAKTVEKFFSERILNEESNIQYGEGGAGTFSDGKLNTGIKDPRIKKVLEIFVENGAPEEILYDAKPHIGTDKLPSTIKNIREKIIALGGEVIFGAKMTDIISENGKVQAVIYEKAGESFTFETSKLVLAIGNSARDTFKKLYSLGFALEAKPFAVGVRIEHKAEDINKAQYGVTQAESGLRTADYKLFTHLENGRGVYTFCMCPGGTVTGATSLIGHVVTNGMSEYLRDAENSNAALLVGIDSSDFGTNTPLDGIYYQEEIEKKAYKLGGENYNAPCQLVGDFLKGRKNETLGSVKPTYRPGVTPSNLCELFPEYITESLKEAIPQFANKIQGYDNPDAVLTAPETRSSSPVRILRDESFNSINIKGIYPCGEGAGYAGGITSSAVDGIKTAEMILQEETDG